MRSEGKQDLVFHSEFRVENAMLGTRLALRLCDTFGMLPCINGDCKQQLKIKCARKTM